MITLSEPEVLLTIREVARHRLVATRRFGVDCPVSGSLVVHWIKDGVRGVHLESMKIGKIRLVTKSALERFLQAVNKTRRTRTKKGVMPVTAA